MLIRVTNPHSNQKFVINSDHIIIIGYKSSNLPHDHPDFDVYTQIGFINGEDCLVKESHDQIMEMVNG